ncbi:MAG: RsmB/NOP family class I SAM-dependent RNA methyltransferase [Eubacterium sp.]|nr:RsmB/NOP family class I SAM-dependent RNA methyltransferase [Eubacterium sp.]
MRLPEEFQRRMERMLGAEAPAFFACYQEVPKRGLRVNPLKTRALEFLQNPPFPVSPVPWVENGFYVPADVRPAQHPYYSAGIYYLQEPSAMTPADRLPVEAGDRILDLCAAPGGKATQLAGKLFSAGGSRREYAPGKGILVANEISNSRAKALLRNLELAGAPGCFVTNEHAGRLAEVFPAYFDKILVDAPCSGEGMFRRQEEVAGVWSPERTAYFANLQRGILEEAVRMLKPDGLLMYSTCTFSAEENEGTVFWFLRNHPEMSLAEIAPYEGFAPGHPEWLAPELITDPALAAAFAETDSEMIAQEIQKKCVRIWPHRMDGEGHFLALFRKTDVSDLEQPERENHFVAAAPGGALQEWQKRSRRDSKANGSRSDSEGDGNRRKAGRNRRDSIADRSMKKEGSVRRKTRSGRSIPSENGTQRKIRSGRSTSSDSGAQSPRQILQAFLETMGIHLSGTIDCRNERLYLVPDLPEGVGKLNFLRNGVFLGEARKGRFIPSQPFALFLSADDCSPGGVIRFSPEDPRLKLYLEGQTVVLENGLTEENSRTEESSWTEESGKGEENGRTEKNSRTEESSQGKENGWKLVCADGFGIGWAKLTGSILKNKYPASWRS